MATSKCLPKLKGTGWALISWGLRARKGNTRIIQLTYKYGRPSWRRTPPCGRRQYGAKIFFAEIRRLSLRGESRLEIREKGDKNT